MCAGSSQRKTWNAGARARNVRAGARRSDRGRRGPARRARRRQGSKTRRAELEIAATRQVLGNGPDGFIITDRAGIILQANPAATQLLGVSGRLLLRKPLSLFIDEVDPRMFRWRVNNAHAWNQGEWPVRVRPRNGPSFIAGLTVTAFTGIAGRPPDLRWFLREIGSRQRAEELAVAQEFTHQMLVSEQAARTVSKFRSTIRRESPSSMRLRLIARRERRTRSAVLSQRIAPRSRSRCDRAWP